MSNLINICHFDLFDYSYSNFLQKAIVHGLSIQAIVSNCIKTLRVNVWTTHQTYDIISIQQCVFSPTTNVLIGYATLDWGEDMRLYSKTVKFLQQICVKLVQSSMLGITTIDITIDSNFNLYATDICTANLFDFSLLYHSICQTISGGFSKYEHDLSHLDHFVGINTITTHLFEQITHAELLNFFKRCGIVCDSRDRYLSMPLLFDTFPSCTAFSIIILGMCVCRLYDGDRNHVNLYTTFCLVACFFIYRYMQQKCFRENVSTIDTFLVVA